MLLVPCLERLAAKRQVIMDSFTIHQGKELLYGCTCYRSGVSGDRKNPRLLHTGLTHACRDRHLPRSVHRRQAYIQDSAVGDITCPVLEATLDGSGNLQIPPSHVV